MHHPAADLLAALRLQIEWGADEALDGRPLSRLAAPVPAATVPAANVPAANVKPSASRRTIEAHAAATPTAAAAAQAAARATSLAELEAELAGFEGCALSITATSLVFGSGSQTASLMLVGDVPGADEDRLGRPFAGRDGELLDLMLGSIGLSRDSVRLAMAVPWRPPGGRQPTAAELAACAPFVHRHIALVAPTHLLAIGALAQRALLGEAAGTIRDRGRWTKVQLPGTDQPRPVIALRALEQIRNRTEHRSAAWAVLRQIRRALGPTNN